MVRHNAPPTPQRLRELLDIQPDGRLVWRVRRGGAVRQGEQAGRVSPQGYVVVGIDGAKYLAHRVVWCVRMGRWPQRAIDHINGVKTDNRPDNLRLATTQENARNVGARKNSTTGAKGVYQHKPSGRYYASIRTGEKRTFLGSFASIADARHAYATAATTTHGEFANTGVNSHA